MNKLITSSIIIGVTGYLLLSFTSAKNSCSIGTIPVHVPIGNAHKGHKKKKNKHHHGKDKNSTINININTRKKLDVSIEPKGKHNHGNNGHHGQPGNDIVIVFDQPTGHERAEKAKHKHHKFKPKKEKEAHTEIRLIVARNNFLIVETHDKIALARKHNHKKHEAGLISVTVFNDNIRFLDSCEKRRSSLKIKVKG